MIPTSAPRAVLIAAMCSLALAACAAAGSTTTTQRPSRTGGAGTTTATTAPTPGTSANACSEADYASRAFCYLKTASVRNTAIDTDCGPLLAHDLRDPGHVCLNDIESYQTFLTGAQNSMHLQDPASAPAKDREPASWLARAVGDDLKAAQMAISALHAHDYVGFLDAWGVHGKAGRDLQTAGDTFFNR